MAVMLKQIDMMRLRYMITLIQKHFQKLFQLSTASEIYQFDEHNVFSQLISCSSQNYPGDYLDCSAAIFMERDLSDLSQGLFLIGQDLINLGQFTNDLLLPLLTCRAAKQQSMFLNKQTYQTTYKCRCLIVYFLANTEREGVHSYILMTLIT